MKIILASILVATALTIITPTTMAADHTASTTLSAADPVQREVTIKFFNHRGLTLAGRCGDALITGFLVAFNIMGSNLDHPVAGSNLLPLDQYFQYDNDNVASSSTGWVRAQFEVVCDSCGTLDATTGQESPATILKNPKDYLLRATVHQQLEAELLLRLKSSKSWCPEFEHLRNVEIVFGDDASVVAASKSGPTNPTVQTVLQQDLSIVVDGFDQDKATAGSSVCLDALEGAVVTAMRSELEESLPWSVAAITTDSTGDYPHGTDSLSTTPTKATSIPAPASTPTSNPTFGYLRNSRKTTAMVGNDTTGLSQLSIDAHVDLTIPANLQQQDHSGAVAKHFSTMGFSSTQDHLGGIARHGRFEDAVARILRNSSSDMNGCDAFGAVSNVRVSFGGMHEPTVAADTVTATAVDMIEQAFVVRLEGIQMDSPPDETCIAIFERTQVNAYNRAHGGTSGIEAQSVVLHSVEVTATESETIVGRGSAQQLGKWFPRYHFWFSVSMGGIFNARCNFCNPDNNDRYHFMMALKSDTHTAFEQEFRQELLEHPTKA